VFGTSTNRIGVVGTSNTESGVFGISAGFGPGLGPRAGVAGTSTDKYGVFGTSTSNVGVQGVSTNSIGVRGQGPTGVDGRGEAGVVGVGNGTGFLGFSPNGIGARCDSDNGTGFLGVCKGGRAGRFVGDVLVEGNFTTVGGAKSAAVAQVNGVYRRLYAVESPESWFEDFGEDRLVNGRARVRLDPEFNALVRGDKYHIFLTPKGDSKGLYVSSQGPNGFEVRQQQGGTSTLEFDYRVVAKRRDIPGRRLERVDVPPPPPPLPAHVRELRPVPPSPAPRLPER
jgi:hypothetical protein